MSINKMKMFEALAWRLQLEASKLALNMEELKMDNLKLQLIGRCEEWEVTLCRKSDHADDEKRSADGN